MKFGLHKMTWGNYFDPSDLGTFFNQAREAGAETVEFRPPDAAMNGEMRKIGEIRKMAEENGLELLFSFAYPRGIDMRSEDPGIREQAVNHLIRGIRAVKALGGTKMGGVLYSDWPTRYDDDLLNRKIKYDRTKRSIECMQKAMPTAEECGTLLYLEPLNRYENYIINTVSEGIEFLRQVSSSHCKLLLDVYHMNIEEDDIESAILSAKGYIGHFHVSEPNRMIPHHAARIGWKGIGNALRAAGYDGTVTIEAVVTFDEEATYPMRMWRDLLPDNSIEGRIEAMRKGLSYIRNQFEGSTI